MQKSARVLGQEYGLTAQEMNRVLLKHGYIEGEPGDYTLTEKARQYAVEKDFNRGTGGYPSYNRYWTTRTFDDSIMDELDVTPELISEVRYEISSARTKHHAVRVEARIKAETHFETKQVTFENSKKNSQEPEELMAAWKKAGEIGLIILGLVAIGYTIYKAAPKVKKWLDKQHQEDDNE